MVRFFAVMHGLLNIYVCVCVGGGGGIQGAHP